MYYDLVEQWVDRRWTLTKLSCKGGLCHAGKVVNFSPYPAGCFAVSSNKMHPCRPICFTLSILELRKNKSNSSTVYLEFCRISCVGDGIDENGIIAWFPIHLESTNLRGTHLPAGMWARFGSTQLAILSRCFLFNGLFSRWQLDFPLVCELCRK